MASDELDTDALARALRALPAVVFFPSVALPADVVPPLAFVDEVAVGFFAVLPLVTTGAEGALVESVSVLVAAAVSVDTAAASVVSAVNAFADADSVAAGTAEAAEVLLAVVVTGGVMALAIACGIVTSSLPSRPIEGPVTVTPLAGSVGVPPG